MNKSPTAEQQEPLRAFRFLVEVEDRTGKGAENRDWDENSVFQVGGFSRFSGIQITVETLEARSGSELRGVREQIPTLTKYQPVTLTKGVIADNGFLEWLFAAAADAYAAPQIGTDYAETYPYSLNILALGDDGQPGVAWRLLDALPIGYEVTPMDGSTSEVLCESLTFAISGVIRDNNPGKRSYLS